MADKELNNEELKKVVGGKRGFITTVAVIDPSYCASCGACSYICPMGAIHEVNGYFKVNAAICVGEECGHCLEECDLNAISIE